MQQGAAISLKGLTRTIK